MHTDLYPHPIIEQLREDLAGIELDVLTSYTVADAMREGARHSAQKIGGYVDETSACGLGAAYLAAAARGYIPATPTG